MVERMSGLSREFIIHPGETLKEILEDRHMTQRELALRTGVKEPHVSGIVNCKKPISASFAKKLEYALGIDAMFWVNLQANYDKELADYEEYNQISGKETAVLQVLATVTTWAKEEGLLADDVQGPALVIEWRKLLNVSNLERLSELSQVGAYRLATVEKVDPYILLAWLKVCDVLMGREHVHHALDLSMLRQRLPMIRMLTFEDIDTIRFKLKHYFAECGIKFAIVKHIPGAPVHGVITRNKDGTLSLVMTVRRKYADIFWFTLFHEIGHILNGDITDRLVDYETASTEVERRANEFAADVLIDPEKYSAFVAASEFDLPHIRQFCAKQSIPPYILIGRLQRDKYLTYTQYTSEKVRYHLDL